MGFPNTAAAGPPDTASEAEAPDGGGYFPLFDGVSLSGWRTVPRVYGTEYPGGPSILELFDRRGLARPVEPEKHAAHWFVEDGVLVGEQDSPGSGYGGYLVSEQAFGDVEDFLTVWRWDDWNDWNELRIRCVGTLPVITTWVNGLKVAELDTASLDSPNYDPDAVLGVLGERGHIALEVHDNDAMFGEARWGKGAQCGWRNIRIKDLTKEEAR